MNSAPLATPEPDPRDKSNHGQTPGMFSEGMRSKGSGLTVNKTGTTRLAIDANYPILSMTVR